MKEGGTDEGTNDEMVAGHVNVHVRYLGQALFSGRKDLAKSCASRLLSPVTSRPHDAPRRSTEL